MELSAHGLGFSSPTPHARAVSGLCSTAGHTSRLQHVALSRLPHSSTCEQNCGTFPDSSRHHSAPDLLFSLVSPRNRATAILPLHIGLLVAFKPRSQVYISLRSQKKTTASSCNCHGKYKEKQRQER